MPDPFARPLPMQSLATEEDNWAWNKPPEYADYQDFVESLKDKLTSDEVAKEEILDMLFIGATLEDVVNTIATLAFSEGKITPDAAELAKFPLAVFILDLAMKEDVAVKIFSQTPQDTEAQDMNNKLMLMNDLNPEGFEDIKSNLKEKVSKDKLDSEESKESFLKMENENASTV
tara:strand:+ start:326 stop:847 length:522 start_codon:yes stop_codon:yes gene_type:complete